MDPTAQILEQIGQTTERIVTSPGFMNLLGDAIARKVVERDPYPFAVDLRQLATKHVLVEPRKLPSGKLVLLTQVPIRHLENISLTVLAKDPSLLGKPRAEGRELENFAIVSYRDLVPGNLLERKAWRFNPDLQEELERQLKALTLQEHQFFYVNVINDPTSPEQ